jgi:hypothetical protein
MAKVFAEQAGVDVIANQLHIGFDLTFTDNSGRVLQNARPQTNGGNIPRQIIPFDGSATNVNNAVEARCIAIGAGLGITVVAADVVMIGTIQGA